MTTPQKFEYHVQAQPTTGPGWPMDMVDVLNRFGEEGWELVTKVEGPEEPSVVQLLLKRPKRDEVRGASAGPVFDRFG